MRAKSVLRKAGLARAMVAKAAMVAIVYFILKVGWVCGIERMTELLLSVKLVDALLCDVSILREE